MKANLLKVPNVLDASFSFRQFKQPNINSRWHFHAEIELIHIQRGTGTQFMGDDIKRFEADEIILVGSNLPHFWRYDDDMAHDEEQVCATVIHFTEHLWGNRFVEMPENKLLKNLLEKSKRGLLLRGELRLKVAQLIEKIKLSEGTFRLIYLLECLAVMSLDGQNECVPMASLGFQHQSSEAEHERVNAIYEYAFKHFKEPIPLTVIASKAGLVPSSFCRYFKSKTGKSFTDFVLELRVSHACKLLMDGKMNNKNICFESGFNNTSSFHKHFKNFTGMSPQMYQMTFAPK